MGGDRTPPRSLPAFNTTPISRGSRPASLLESSTTSSTPRARGSASQTLGRSTARRPSLVPDGRTIRRVTSRLFRISEGPAPAPEREWTLFSQRMENEGQLPLTPRPPAQRLVSHNHTSADSSPLPPRPLTSIDIPHPSTPSIFGTASQVQSPVDDQSLLDNPRLLPSALPHEPELPPPDIDASPPKLTLKEQIKTRLHLTTLQKNIIKCSIAYFLGSLFTFNPHLSQLVGAVAGDGPSASAHMVATVAVYFNPAKTAGGMVEADIYCLIGLLFAAFVSLSSMNGFWFFEVQPGYEWLADSIVIFWIGLSMSIVAWTKQWMAKPTFNPACSMAAIILFTVVVKEGGLPTLLQVSVLVMAGALISNLVCYTVWSQSATSNLRKSMTTTLGSFSTILALVTDTFLLEESQFKPSQDKIQRAIENHQASFVKLKKDLSEAHSEALFGGPSRPAHDAGRDSLGKAYEDAVDSLNRLGQHLNGLRSGTRLQYELSKAHMDGKIRLSNSAKGRGQAMMADDNEEKALLQAAANMFGELVQDVGGPLKALSTACEASFRSLSQALANGSGPFHSEDFERLTEDLERAMRTFESTSSHAIVRIYRKGLFEAEALAHRASADLASVASLVTDPEVERMVSQHQNENLFLVYFFIFTLQEFTRELDSLIDALGRVCLLEQAKRSRGNAWMRLFYKLQSTFGWRHSTAPSISRDNRPLKRPISTYFISERPKQKTSWFPKVTPHAPNTLQTPSRKHLSFWGRVKQSIWAIGSRLRESDIKYAVKAGMATALLAAPAFFDRTRPIFVQYRGEWALISFFVVISPTIGATNNLSLHRVLGTMFGAATAAGIYSLFPDNAVVLSIFGFFFSIPCFYYIVSFPQYATTGRFVLLTYNLTCLFSYNTRERDTSVLNIAIERSISVTIGVVWAFIVSRVWWPSEARRELSKVLGELCLNMGWLYIRMVAHNSFAPEPEEVHADGSEEEPSEDSPLIPSALSSRLQGSIHEFMAMELHLQIKLIQLQGLLASAQHEPRLKGPFPVKLYRGILTSLQTILDRLHSMRCVTTREEWYTNVRRDYILPFNKERRDVTGNITLYLSILSSAFQLKTPLPPYLPPVETSRQTLVDAIKKLEPTRSAEVQGSKQLLFFAYAMTMKGVTQELEVLGKTLQDAFGVIGQNQFDALFAAANEVV